MEKFLQKSMDKFDVKEQANEKQISEIHMKKQDKNINGEIHVNKHENNQWRNHKQILPITSYCGAFVRIQSFDVPIKVPKNKIHLIFVSNLRNTLKSIEENTATREKKAQSNLQFKVLLVSIKFFSSMHHNFTCKCVSE